MNYNNVKYKHGNGRTYTVIDQCKIQVNDIWLSAVIYTDNDSNKYVRSLLDFIAKFTKV